MKQNTEEIRGTFVVLLGEGDILPAQIIKASHKGLEIQSGDIQTTVDPTNVEKILEVKATKSFADLLTDQKNHTAKAALARTLCGILEIEELANAYTKEVALEPNSLKIIIFESGGLALTILPERVSHDVDAAVPMQFMRFCEQKMRQSHGAIPEFSSTRILQYLGAWEERASKIEGLTGASFFIPHPLDTMMQKLLRADEKRFHTNDKEDIRRILKCLNPNKETLVQLLIENPSRYRIPKEKEQSLAIERNTNWFSNEFLPEHSTKSLAELAEKAEEATLEKYGFVPLKPIQTTLQKDRKLADLLHKKDPPTEIT